MKMIISTRYPLLNSLFFFYPFLLNDGNLRNSDKRSDQFSVPDFQEPFCNYRFIDTTNNTYQAPTSIPLHTNTSKVNV